MYFKVTSLVLVALLISFGTVVKSLNAPSPNSDRETYLEFYAQCSNVDPNFVVDKVLDQFIATLEWLNTLNGIEPFSVGWMAPGPANDLGWSYNLYLAAQAQQRCFGIKWFIEDEISSNDVINAMNRLIDRGVKLLMAASAEFVADVGTVAIENPEIMFVIPFPLEAYFNISNIRSVAMNVFETTYLTGYIAESMTPDSIPYIGELGAIHLFTEYQNQNAFLFGMQDAARDLGREPRTMVYWWTNSFSDPDKSLFAVQDITSNYDVHMVGQTPDRYESQLWLRDNGYHGSGATADMGQFLGSTVYASNHVRWDIPGLYIYGLLVSAGGENWGDTPLILPHNVWIGSLGPGTLSVEVPSDVKDRVSNIMTLMQTSPFASMFIWCGDRVAKILPEGEYLDNVTNCLTFPQLIGMEKLHPDILDLGDFVIPIETITRTVGVKIFESILVGITIILTFVFMVVFMINRNSTVIKLSSVTMTMLSLFGALVSLVALALYIPDSTAPLCRSTISMYLFGYYLIYSAFMSKIFGFGLIRYYTSKLKERRVSFINVVWIAILCFAIGSGFIIWWLAADNIGSQILTGETTSELDTYEIREVCALSDSGIIAIGFCAGYGILLIIAVLIGSHVLGRNYLNEWKADGRRMIITCWSTLVCTAIGLTLVLSLTDNQDTLEILVFLLAWLVILSVLVFYNGPKLWILLFRSNSKEAKNFNMYNRRAFNASSNSNQSTSLNNSTGTRAISTISSNQSPRLVTSQLETP
jgi:basic membrane lipoprotein Med (substrate-binding protein (PBP1-ABC) superfamily)